MIYKVATFNGRVLTGHGSTIEEAKADVKRLLKEAGTTAKRVVIAG